MSAVKNNGDEKVTARPAIPRQMSIALVVVIGVLKKITVKGHSKFKFILDKFLQIIVIGP